MYVIINEQTNTVLSVHATIQSATASTHVASEGEIHDIIGLHKRWHEPLKGFLRNCFPKEEGVAFRAPASPLRGSGPVSSLPS